MPLPRPRLWSLALTAAGVITSMPWAFGYLLPQHGTRVLGLAALSTYSAYAVFVIALVSWASRRWLALAACALLLCGQVVTLGSLYVGDGMPDPARPRLRVMTVNLLFGTADTAQVVDLVRTRHVDVLALEELSPGAVAGLERAGLRAELPYAVNRARPGAEGTGLWSRLPFTDVPVRQLRFNAVAVDIRVGGRTVRARAVHPVPPIPPATWHHDLEVLRAELMDDVDVQTIVLGDLNSSVHHRELRRLMGRRWRDAAEADGHGLVRTWTPRLGLPSVLDLDHVLIDRGMTVASWESAAIRGSDHRAVMVDLALR
ncbi:MAG: hypothetical protein QOJ79_1384 [Actinomycetota bacterium]|jgi:endonuclease/exonuclease/phosphatase (EEP) superfamily protein YafD|nr:hypothetical protein [Actinomycetota bacterium]